MTVRSKRAVRNSNQKVSRKAKNPKNISLSNAHPLIQKSWNKHITTNQNYEKLGLLSHLQGNKTADKRLVTEEPLKIQVEFRNINDAPTLSVERDIVVMPIGVGTRLNSKSILTQTAPSSIVEQMIEESLNGREATPRFQSEQETLLFEGWMHRYGDDYYAMSKDKKNKFQLTEGQIKRKITRILRI